jgi:subtilisin family serine protease
VLDEIVAAGGLEVRHLSRSVVVDVPDAVARKRIALLAGVRWIEPEIFFPVAVRAVPDDPHYPDAWHLHPAPIATPATAINVEAAWDQARGLDANGTPVRVAVLDDGFDLDHVDALFAPIGLDLSADPSDADPSPGLRDDHGTQTAGVIGAIGFNGRGVTGVCPACEILPVRLIGSGGAPDLYTSGSAAAEAIEPDEVLSEIIKKVPEKGEEVSGG